ncbi:MAG: methionyl-tRNA formyltransferase [Candidatus Cloacimonadaceae bacterium]
MSALNRIVFLGSSAFAVPALQKLIESDQFQPLAVITQPDKPGGRKLQLTQTPVKSLALEQGLELFQPEDINSPDSVEVLKKLAPDLLVTVAYGQKLKKAVRKCAQYGAINLHPSLLPELRGAAPIPFALWQGMIQTGVTIFRLASRMDAGPIYYQKQLYIFPNENATDLASRLAFIGAKCLLQFLSELTEQPWGPVEQDENKATYCRKLEKDDLLLDFTKQAQQLHNQIRALSLSPGAHTFLNQKQIKILEADVIDAVSDLPPGSITALSRNIGIVVQTGDRQLLLKQVQPAGKQIMSAWAFQVGARLAVGEVFDSHA